jgi:hypothetical protein
VKFHDSDRSPLIITRAESATLEIASHARARAAIYAPLGSILLASSPELLDTRLRDVREVGERFSLLSSST